jgi:hypothetical protein
MPGIEDTPAPIDTKSDPNANISMVDFVRQQTGIKPEAESETEVEAEAPSNAQDLGNTEPEQEDARLAKEKADKEKADALANETPEEREAREQKERDEKEETARKEKDSKENEDGKKGGEEQKPKDPVPYERFEEVNTKYKQTAEEYEKIKPLAESHAAIQEYCSQWGITQDQFRNLLEVQRLLNTDPAKALEKILPIVEQVQGFTGDKLPADLQKEVDMAQLPLERAREIAKLRAQNQLGGQSFQRYQQIQQERAQQQFQADQVKAVNAWMDSKKNDLDFKPRADKNGPKGRFEFVYDAMQARLAERDAQGRLVHEFKNPNDVTKLLEECYQEVVRSLAPLSRKAATKPRLTHGGSGSHNTGEFKPENAKSMAEAIRGAAAKHGY